MFYRFKAFQPVVDVAPIAFGWHGNDIVGRARALLHMRTSGELMAAIELVNWLLDAEFIREECEARLASLSGMLEPLPVSQTHALDLERIDGSVSMHARNLDSASFCLSLCIGRVDLTTYDKFPRPSWHELFAVLALGVIDRAVEDEDFYDSLPKQSEFHHLWRTQTRVADWLIEAMDAVAVAEGLAREAASDVSAGVIAVSCEAVAEHAKMVDLLMDLFEFYRAGSFDSATSAIDAFCGKHPAKLALVGGDIEKLRYGLAKLTRIS